MTCAYSCCLNGLGFSVADRTSFCFVIRLLNTFQRVPIWAVNLRVHVQVSTGFCSRAIVHVPVPLGY